MGKTSENMIPHGQEPSEREWVNAYENDPKRELREVLLELHVAISRHEDFKSGFRSRTQQSPILDAEPAEPSDGLHIVRRKVTRELRVNVLVEQDFQDAVSRLISSREAFASQLSTAAVCSLVTLGKLS